MNNSLIYMITNTPTSVLSGGIVPLTTIARRRCKSLQNNSDSITMNTPGYYKVNVSVTFVPSAAGEASLAVQKNGVTVPGLTGAVTATADNTSQIIISGIVRVGCGEVISTLTILNTGIAITTSNVSIDVEYLN